MGAVEDFGEQPEHLRPGRSADQDHIDLAVSDLRAGRQIHLRSRISAVAGDHEEELVFDRPAIKDEPGRTWLRSENVPEGAGGIPRRTHPAQLFRRDIDVRDAAPADKDHAVIHSVPCLYAGHVNWAGPAGDDPAGGLHGFRQSKMIEERVPRPRRDDTQGNGSRRAPLDQPANRFVDRPVAAHQT